MWDYLFTSPAVLTSNQKLMVNFMKNKSKAFFFFQLETRDWTICLSIPLFCHLSCSGSQKACLPCGFPQHPLNEMLHLAVDTKQWVDPVFTFIKSSFINSPQLFLFSETSVSYRGSLVIFFFKKEMIHSPKA